MKAIEKAKVAKLTQEAPVTSKKYNSNNSNNNSNNSDNSNNSKKSNNIRLHETFEQKIDRHSHNSTITERCCYANPYVWKLQTRDHFFKLLIN